MKDIKPIIDSFRRANGLDFSFVSDDVFSGYKTAYGTYDVTINKLFVNVNLLENAPVYKVLFYLYHEMRHALQYAHPNSSIKKSERVCHMSYYTMAFVFGCLTMHG